VENTVENLWDVGISTCFASCYNAVRSNNVRNIFGRISQGQQLGSGIQVFGSSTLNNLTQNRVTNCMPYGLHLEEDSDSNYVYDNYVFNSSCGIYLNKAWNAGCDGNSFVNNTLSNSSLCAVWVASCSNNTFHHNNFVNNTSQVYSNSSVNVWDDGYPSGGNYWSNHILVDGYSGAGQNVTGKDGLCDTAFVINAENRDHYPLLGSATANLLVYTFVDETEYTDVEILVDAESPQYFSMVNVSVGIGSHNVTADHSFYRLYGIEIYKYTFSKWEDDSTSNPRQINVQQNMNITAYYTEKYWGSIQK